MKQSFITIIGFLLMCFSHVQSQEVFPTKNAEWKVRGNVLYINQWSESVLYHVADYSVSFTGRDSLWNGNTYQLFQEGGFVRGGLRVDYKKVWVTFDWKEEILLYDFGVNVGDTVVHGAVYRGYPSYQGYYYDNKPDYTCVSIVDSVKEEGGRRKIYVNSYSELLSSSPFDKEFVGLSTDIWQEGVGSLYGFFMCWANMGSWLILVGGGAYQYTYDTMSVTQNGEILYSNPQIPEIPEYPEIVYGMDEVITGKWRVSYDKSSGILSVQSEDSNLSATLQVYDLSGKLVFQTAFNGSCTLPLKDTHRHYICKVVCNNQVIYSSKIRL